MSGPPSDALREPILVTGATGFIGRHLVQRLVDHGRSVRALVLPDESIDAPWADAVEVVRGDVGDRDAVVRAVEGVGTLFHLAAIVEDWGAEGLHRRVTIDGTRHVMEAAAHGGIRAVLASSIVVYGPQLDGVPCHEDVPHGQALGPYSRSKQAQERIARELAATTDLDLVIVRPANVYGPGSRPWVDELVHLLRQRQITLIGSGDNDAGLVHVDNLVDLLLLAASEPKARGRIYNAADPGGITFARYVGDLARLAGARPPKGAPRSVAWVLGVLCEALWKVLPMGRRPPITREALNLAAARYRLPIDRARDELGYHPRVTYPEALADLETYVQNLP